MFAKHDLDDRGELPAPFNVEKHNFNPHEVRGDFDFDRNGKARVLKTAEGAGDGSNQNNRQGAPGGAGDQNHRSKTSTQAAGFADKRGSRVSTRGYRIDKHGNMLDNKDRKKFDATHMTPDGDLPKLFNYNGRRFDIVDTIGQLEKDSNGNIVP